MRERPQLILASASPRRRELLARLNRPFRVVPPRADETLPKGEPPERAACILARRKAESVAAREIRGLVLGADTLVVAGEAVIGKPRDAHHAAEILTLLSSQPHDVITGICILDTATGRSHEAFDRTRITMRPMTSEQIQEYIASGEPMGKAGAYAIQETGDRFVERVEGSFSNVVGLPLELLERLLPEFEDGAA